MNLRSYVFLDPKLGGDFGEGVLPGSVDLASANAEEFLQIFTRWAERSCGADSVALRLEWVDPEAPYVARRWCRQYLVLALREVISALDTAPDGYRGEIFNIKSAVEHVLRTIPEEEPRGEDLPI